ncbi:hypothetical protein WAG19_28440 [Bacillus cereus]|uniref:hypothetical protein n=1 Tax=Bacillus cereus TaxID=1396 RepID=UPI003012E202
MANVGSATVSVIDTSSNTVTANVPVGNGPFDEPFNKKLPLTSCYCPIVIHFMNI